MKKQQETSLLKITEKFDKELLKLLSGDLKTLKAAKNRYFSRPDNNNNNLMVA